MNPQNAPSNPVPGAPSPIADRSYRNYDGALRSHATRWWVVALSNLRSTLRKPGFWILAVIGMLSYVVAGFMLRTNVAMESFGGGPSQSYATFFFEALSRQEFWIFLTALVVGTNIIAADIRANALMIYLSKPITKGDYLLGKWVGTFLPLYLISLLPALLFFAACALGLFGDGFLHKEPTVLWRMLLATAVPAVVHSSILVGISAWSKSGRVAGAVYAGFYLVTSVIAAIIGSIQMRAHSVSSMLIGHLSVTGAIQGLIQSIYHVRLPRQFFQLETPPLPSAAFGWEMFALCAVLSVLGVAMARVKINAVEVVKG